VTRTVPACLGQGGGRGCGKPSALAAMQDYAGRNAVGLLNAKLAPANRRHH
jgi:hypothetical protein